MSEGKLVHTPVDDGARKLPGVLLSFPHTFPRLSNMACLVKRFTPFSPHIDLLSKVFVRRGFLFLNANSSVGFWLEVTLEPVFMHMVLDVEQAPRRF